MYVAIAGNIGSGKTTLTRMLASHYGWTPRFEPVVNNPYLDDYYKDIKRWVFELEVFFLKERVKDMMEIVASEDTIVVDRSIYEGVHVFVANNHLEGNLSDRDYDTYMQLYELLTHTLQMPRLMIYLRSSVPHLLDNINKRRRECELNMSVDYLSSLNKQYEQFITQKYKGEVLTIDVDNLDFEHRAEDFEMIVNKINSFLMV